jgi:hypothetical protein
MTSRPAVAWPAMTSGSLWGSTSRTFVWLAANASACSWASLRVCPATTTCAPVRSMACRRFSGVRSGMTTVALWPSAFAAMASEWPCDPTEYVITSVSPSSLARVASRL